MGYQLNSKIRELVPYDTVKGDFRIRLDANESFIDIPSETRDEIIKSISENHFNRYPDPRAEAPCRAFAQYFGLELKNVSAFNGSDELLFLINSCFLMKGEKAVFLSPEFSMYRFYNELSEGQQITVKKAPDGSINADDIINAVNENGARLVAFSNPCNPTGVGLERGEVLRIIESCPDCLVCVDEAYMEFWNQSVIDKVNDYDNLMVLKTCSKAFRMAGIRCGFCAANEKLTNALLAVKSPYNVNSMTQAAAAAVLSRPKELDAAIAHVKDAMQALYVELSEMAEQFPDKMKVRKTCTNFAYVEMPDGGARRMYEALKKEGILVRCFGEFLRITTGSDEENAELIRAFENHLFD